MFLDTTRDLYLTATSAGGGSVYFTMPYKGRVTDVKGTIIVGPSSTAETVTLTAPYNSSVSTLGTLAFTASTSLAAGSTGTYTKNTSSGNAYLSAGSVVKLNVPAASVSNSTNAMALLVEITPY